MGYLTTFTVYNDGVDLVKEHAQDFANKIYYAAINSQSCELAVGNFCNLVKVQKCRHASDNTIYVHMGNTVVEINPYSQETKNMLERNPEFFEKVVKFLDREVKELKTMLKQSKAK
jgi:hypothetical protein